MDSGTDAPDPHEPGAPEPGPTIEAVPVREPAAPPPPVATRTYDPEPAPPAPRRIQSRWRSALLVWWAIGWIGVAGLAWLTISRKAPIEWPTMTVWLQSMTPLAFVPIYVVGVTAAVGRRWLLTGACAVLAVVHLCSVAPAFGTRPIPVWADGAPRITVAAANVYDGNRDPAGAARAVLATGADVLVVPEYTRNFATAFAADPASAAYAYQWTKGNSGRVAILSKLPFASTATPQSGAFFATTVEVDVGGRRVRIVGVHTQSPRSGDRPRWTRDLAALRALARQHLDQPLVLAGDFNATRWNPPFGAFFALGLTDAHEDRGKGFSTSWPDHGRAYGFFGPVLRLDHALVDPGVAVVSVHDFEIPGSDHRGFVTELAVGTNGQGG